MSTVPPALVMNLALPPLEVPVKFVVAPLLVVIVALPAVAEPSKFTVPSLMMDEVAAVVVLWKFSTPPAPLLIVAVPAEALVKKSI